MLPNLPPATLAHLAGGAWITAGEPVVLLGDSGTGKTHLLIALGTAAAEHGRRVRYITTAGLVNELVEAADPICPAEPFDAEQLLFLLYTSGTTGKPKGAMHRHASIRDVADLYGSSVLGVAPGDRCLSVPKLFFAYGLGNSCFFPLAAGATEYQPLTDREAGFRTAAVVDPFGNILGLMYNPHYLEMLRR